MYSCGSHIKYALARIKLSMLHWFPEIRISAVNAGIYNSSSLFGDCVYTAYILMIFIFKILLVCLYIRIITCSLGCFWSFFEYVVQIRNLSKNSLKLCVFFLPSISLEVSRVNGNVKYSWFTIWSHSFTSCSLRYGNQALVSLWNLLMWIISILPCLLIYTSVSNKRWDFWCPTRAFLQLYFLLRAFKITNMYGSVIFIILKLCDIA